MLTSARPNAALVDCRARVLHALSDAASAVNVGIEDARLLATLYEAAMLMKAYQFVTAATDVIAAYLHIADCVVFNMRQNAAYILRRVPPSVACVATQRRLAEGTLRARRDEAVERDLAALYAASAADETRFQALAASVQVDSALRCPNCRRQDGITRTLVQMNAGDEGMKTCCTCANCSFNWKMG
jgi:DNA-directed RNA polymerase subunit M/transcription elongation factor TFIIS